MRTKIQKPPIGTKMYFVRENYYYVPGDSAPKMEYCVCEGEIKEFLIGGFTEIYMVGPGPAGHEKVQVATIRRLDEIGERVFYTAKEAAMLAKKKTEKCESIWGWMMDGPMRRTWEKYLEES